MSIINVRICFFAYFLLLSTSICFGQQTQSNKLILHPAGKSLEETLIGYRQAGIFKFGMNLPDESSHPQYTYVDTMMAWENGKLDTLQMRIVKEKGEPQVMLKWFNFKDDSISVQRVNGIYVLAGSFETENHLGVGYSVKTFLEEHPNAQLYIRNGIYYMKPQENDLQFVLDPAAYIGPPIDMRGSHVKFLKKEVLDPRGKITGVLIVR